MPTVKDDNILEVDLEKAKSIGDNIHVVEVDGMLVLIVNPAETIGESNSGKMMGIASTGGFTKIPGDLHLKINMYIGKRIIVNEAPDAENVTD